MSKHLTAVDGCIIIFSNSARTGGNLNKKNTSRFDQLNTLKQLKVDEPFLKDIYSQILQDVGLRLDLAFQSFFRRVKHGENPGYPRFRGNDKYDSFTYPQSGFKLFENVVQLSKIGGVKIKLHRPIEGTIKTCTVRRTPTGKWFVTFVCVVEHTPIKQPVEPSIGIDMGLMHFATMSNGEQVANPRFFRKEEKELAKVQRRLSKQTKGTTKRRKAKKSVALVHERIANKRNDFAHQLSRKLVNRFNTIAVEDLSINDMQKDNFRCINKSIGDVAWRKFLECLSYKAEWAGTHCIQVNPAYTSQNCSRCGNRHKLKLSDRVYHCPSCDLQMDRDVNASINILRLGMESLARPLA